MTRRLSGGARASRDSGTGAPPSTPTDGGARRGVSAAWRWTAADPPLGGRCYLLKVGNLEEFSSTFSAPRLVGLIAIVRRRRRRLVASELHHDERSGPRDQDTAVTDEDPRGENRPVRRSPHRSPSPTPGSSTAPPTGDDNAGGGGRPPVAAPPCSHPPRPRLHPTARAPAPPPPRALDLLRASSAA